MPDLMDGIVETTASRYGYLEVARDSRAERTGGTVNIYRTGDQNIV